MVTALRWGGPALIVLGMIYGAVYLVEVDRFGPPARLAAGVAVTAFFGGLGRYLVDRGHRLLGELVTATFFAGAFLCSWAVPAVTGWPIGTSVLLSAVVALATLTYAWRRGDSTPFAIGVAGLSGIPLAGPLYGGDTFTSSVSALYDQAEMVVPLVVTGGLALGARWGRGWFLPWALSWSALLVSFAIMIDEAADGLIGPGPAVVGLAVVLTVMALAGVRLRPTDDMSPLQRWMGSVFDIVDGAAPVGGLIPVWFTLDAFAVDRNTERIALGVWAVAMVAIAFCAYGRFGPLRIVGGRARQFGAVISASVATLIAIGGLDWYVYLVMVAALFLISVVSEPRHGTAGPEADGLWNLARSVLGAATALGLVSVILDGLFAPLADNPPVLISSWVSMALFAAGFVLSPDLRSRWVLPYGLALALVAASISQDPLTLIVTSALWLGCGLAAVKLGLARTDRSAVSVGLATMAIGVGKFLLVDTPRFDDDLLRAGSFLVAGLVVVLVSIDSPAIRDVLVSHTGGGEPPTPPVPSPAPPSPQAQGFPVTLPPGSMAQSRADFPE